VAAKPDPTPLIVVVGETASGKSALAMKLAEKFNGEIIAADAWTVYRNFDIGTVKPSSVDRARIAHHLIDIRGPKDGFSAALYKPLAQAAIKDIHKRGKLPIIVGGTGLYIDSVLFDYQFLPASDPSLRLKLNQLSVVDLLKRIEADGFDTTSIDLRNKRRLIRLIENNGRRPGKSKIRPNTSIIGIKVLPEQLKERIIKRVDKLFEDGLEQEVASLAEKYGWDIEPMKGIGYREFQNYFASQQTLKETKQKIIKSTLDLAKRQRTWFKRNKSIHWVSKQSEAVEITTTLLNKLAI